MEKNLGLELEDAISRVKILITKVKNLNDLLSVAHQKMQYSIYENERLTEQNRRDINYLTAQINYNFSR